MGRAKLFCVVAVVPSFDFYPPMFLLVGTDNKPVLRVQYFTNGVGGHLLHLYRTKSTKTESAWQARLEYDNTSTRPRHFMYQLRIVWATGRAESRFLGGDYYMKCEAIDPPQF